MALLVTSSTGLQSVYGQDGYNSILQKLETLAALNQNGLRILDDAVSMQGASPAKAQDSDSLRGALSSVGGVNSANGIVIVGDQRVFPSHSVPNPVTDRTVDPDTALLTDNPYGDFVNAPSDCVNPGVPVGRIAAGVSDSAQDFCNLLDWRIALSQQKTPRTGYVEVTSRQWQNTSNFVLSALPSSQRVFVSPDSRLSASNAANLDCKYLYCNLHGFLNSSAWMGYDQGLCYPVTAITPDAFQSQYVSGAIVFTEACYGLATSGKTTSSSCALSLLAAGAGGVIGSTGLAFGTATAQPQNLLDADLMARAFFNAALSGSTIGACLKTAKDRLAQSSSLADPFVKKTLLEFQILGDPSYGTS
jgi:hypothetical protein